MPKNVSMTHWFSSGSPSNKYVRPGWGPMGWPGQGGTLLAPTPVLAKCAWFCGGSVVCDACDGEMWKRWLSSTCSADDCDDKDASRSVAEGGACEGASAYDVALGARRETAGGGLCCARVERLRRRGDSGWDETACWRDALARHSALVLLAPAVERSQNQDHGRAVGIEDVHGRDAVDQPERVGKKNKAAELHSVLDAKIGQGGRCRGCRRRRRRRWPALLYDGRCPRCTCRHRAEQGRPRRQHGHIAVLHMQDEGRPQARATLPGEHVLEAVEVHGGRRRLCLRHENVAPAARGLGDLRNVEEATAGHRRPPFVEALEDLAGALFLAQAAAPETDRLDGRRDAGTGEDRLQAKQQSRHGPVVVVVVGTAAAVENLGPRRHNLDFIRVAGRRERRRERRQARQARGASERRRQKLLQAKQRAEHAPPHFALDRPQVLRAHGAAVQPHGEGGAGGRADEVPRRVALVVVVEVQGQQQQGADVGERASRDEAGQQAEAGQRDAVLAQGGQVDVVVRPARRGRRRRCRGGWETMVACRRRDGRRHERRKRKDHVQTAQPARIGRWRLGATPRVVERLTIGNVPLVLLLKGAAVEEREVGVDALEVDANQGVQHMPGRQLGHDAVDVFRVDRGAFTRQCRAAGHGRWAIVHERRVVMWCRRRITAVVRVVCLERLGGIFFGERGGQAL
ncbi:hypothetical protein SPBR_06714 [Sporothrix brasiliensis 5110]|uniref:Uncharacterized protein n=1 Tax=Sporothrix brasiliensis 5110 TaxID=1398154 RepID=A0A0C2IHQ8_9PEZI|nr:uncharacterized protein SPBR_06714 [Sporothrix brasiliensis 5110]KIH88696.1 hypothetical protein SPBR_06714 [Sporothrix brasiliensis 5110]